ncbi:MAG: hypothetical protein ACTSU5_08545 [Promethearchaeota archaeon]
MNKAKLKIILSSTIYNVVLEFWVWGVTGFVNNNIVLKKKRLVGEFGG